MPLYDLTEDTMVVFEASEASRKGRSCYGLAPGPARTNFQQI